jgi:uncharacterized protein
MRTLLFSLFSGLLFGAGLALSGMTNPNKVLNFLDVAGAWDPSLGLVMAGAIPITALGYWAARRRTRPMAALSFQWPRARQIDVPLLVGAVLFGIGWGLAGYCPAPAVASLTNLSPALWTFLGAMFLGFWLAARVREALNP